MAVWCCLSKPLYRTPSTYSYTTHCTTQRTANQSPPCTFTSVTTQVWCGYGTYKQRIRTADCHPGQNCRKIARTRASIRHSIIWYWPVLFLQQTILSMQYLSATQQCMGLPTILVCWDDPRITLMHPVFQTHTKLPWNVLKLQFTIF